MATVGSGRSQKKKDSEKIGSEKAGRSSSSAKLKDIISETPSQVTPVDLMSSKSTSPLKTKKRAMDDDQPGSGVLAWKKIKILETATPNSLFADDEDDLVEEVIISLDPIQVSVSEAISASVLEPSWTPSILPRGQDSGSVPSQAQSGEQLLGLSKITLVDLNQLG